MHRGGDNVDLGLEVTGDVSSRQGTAAVGAATLCLSSEHSAERTLWHNLAVGQNDEADRCLHHEQDQQHRPCPGVERRKVGRAPATEATRIRRVFVSQVDLSETERRHLKVQI